MTDFKIRPKNQSKPYSQQVKESVSKKKEARKKKVEGFHVKLGTAPINDRSYRIRVRSMSLDLDETTNK